MFPLCPRHTVPNFHLIEIKYEIYISSLGFVFSSPEPKAQASYCHSAPSVAHPSVRRPALTSTFLQPLKGIQRNLTGSKISTSSIEFVFFGPIGTSKMAALVSDWQGQFSISPLKPLNRIQGTWQEARSQHHLLSLWFSGRSKDKMTAPVSDLLMNFRLLLWDPLTEFKNLTGRKISTSSIKFVFFGLIRNTRWPSRASDWLRDFRLLLWSRWIEFNETWQEAKSQCLLTSLCFRADLKKQDGRPDLWLAETFSTSHLKPLNGIQQKPDSTSSTITYLCSLELISNNIYIYVICFSLKIKKNCGQRKL